MSNNFKPTPPGFFLRFFRWYCQPDMLDYIEGDLMEVYRRRLKESGKRKADLHFIKDVIFLFRPGIIRTSSQHQNINNYGMIKSYFKIGWRNLIRNKSYAVINIGGLAVSMTCGILIFALVMHHLNFDNFHANSERLYRIVTEKHRDVIAYDDAVPSPLGEHFRNDHTYAEKIARVFTVNDALITFPKEGTTAKYREEEGLAFAEPEFLQIFNFPLLRGNKDKVLAEPNTMIISERMARKYFGDNNPIGETITLDNRTTFTINGILKDFPVNTDIRCEMFASYSSLGNYDRWMAHETAGWGGVRSGMQCYTLLHPGVNPKEVEDALQLYVKKFRAESRNVHHYKLQPLTDVHFNGNYGATMEKSKLWTIAIIGMFLLATACFNFINMATAQTLRRSKEVGVRKVLGGFRPQLFWQFMAETALIATLGIVVALGLAVAVAPVANEFLNIDIPSSFITNPQTLLFSLAMVIVITLFAGFYPASSLARFQPVSALKGKLSLHKIGGFHTRRVLIAGQFAISQLLIIGMIVIMDQMRYAQQADLGFRKEGIVMINMGTDSTGTRASVLKKEISRLPGVESVSLCYAAPASDNNWGNAISFESSEEVNFRTSMKLADEDYIATFDLELVAGRNISPSDTVREIIVNESMIRKLGLKSPEDILGRIMTADGGDMVAPVVGVLKDFHDRSFHEDISPILLTTLSDDYSSYAVKINLANAQEVMASIEKTWLAQHPDQLFEYEFLDDQIQQFYENDQTILRSIQVFSLLAIFIGSLGLYGLISFMAAQKTKEVGIRKVLGGSVMHIATLFGREFVQLIVVAALIAGPLGWWLMQQWLEDFKFQVPITALTFILATGFTLVIALLTVGYQVFKSATANPVSNLRSE